MRLLGQSSNMSAQDRLHHTVTHAPTSHIMAEVTDLTPAAECHDLRQHSPMGAQDTTSKMAPWKYQCIASISVSTSLTITFRGNFAVDHDSEHPPWRCDLTETCELKAGSVVVTTPDGSDNASRLAWQLLLPRPQVATGQDGRPKLYHYGKRCRSLM